MSSIYVFIEVLSHILVESDSRLFQAPNMLDICSLMLLEAARWVITISGIEAKFCDFCQFYLCLYFAVGVEL